MNNSIHISIENDYVIHNYVIKLNNEFDNIIDKIINLVDKKLDILSYEGYIKISVRIQLENNCRLFTKKIQNLNIINNENSLPLSIKLKRTNAIISYNVNKINDIDNIFNNICINIQNKFNK